MTKTDPRSAQERRSLLITEPNGSVPATPVKNEAAPLNSSTDAQPKVSSAKKALQTNKPHNIHRHAVREGCHRENCRESQQGIAPALALFLYLPLYFILPLKLSI